MFLHSFISILLATALTLGGIMPPRHQCVCADGKITVEVGQRFCKDSGCCQAGSSTPDQTFEPSCGPTLCSPEGCRSTLLPDDVTGLIERDHIANHSDPRELPTVAYTGVGVDGWSYRLPLRAARPTPRDSYRRPPGPSPIRSVILLV